MDQHPFGHLLDQDSAVPPSDDALTSIVRRHRRRRAARSRAAALGAAVVLAGTGAGLGLSGLSTGASHGKISALPASQRGAPAGLRWAKIPAGSAPTAYAALGASPSIDSAMSATPVAPRPIPGMPSICTRLGCGGSFGGLYTEISPLLHRSVGGLTVKAYLVRFNPLIRGVEPMLGLPTRAPSTSGGTATSPPSPQPSPPVVAPATAPVAPPATSPNTTRGTAPVPIAVPEPMPAIVFPACMQQTEVLVQLWRGKVLVGQTVTPSAANVGHPFGELSESVVAQKTGPSIVVVVGETSSSVARVTADFAGGTTDSAVPSSNWVVLLTSIAAPAANRAGVALRATGTSGNVLESATIPHPGIIAAAPKSCVVPPPVKILPEPLPGASGGSSGSAGSGTGVSSSGNSP